MRLPTKNQLAVVECVTDQPLIGSRLIAISSVQKTLKIAGVIAGDHSTAIWTFAETGCRWAEGVRTELSERRLR